MIRLCENRLQTETYSLAEASHAARDQLKWKEIMKRMPPLNPVLE